MPPCWDRQATHREQCAHGQAPHKEGTTIAPLDDPDLYYLPTEKVAADWARSIAPPPDRTAGSGHCEQAEALHYHALKAYAAHADAITIAIGGKYVA